jgi:CBS domain-containing protein
MSLVTAAANRRIHVRRPSLRRHAAHSNGSGQDAATQELAELEERRRILVVGADAVRRATLRKELTAALPSNTMFEEAGEVWEVLEHAPSSGVVMLTGDLQDVTAESLMNLLGNRHPRLPVVTLDTGPHTLSAA